MTGRATREWIGKTADSKIPDYVKLRIWKREDGRCYLTGKKLRPPADAFDYEHKIALVLWTGDGHGNRESNIFLAWRPAHREKTKQDVKAKADSDRVAKKHLGIRPTPKLTGAGFRPAPKQRSASRPTREKFPGDVLARRNPVEGARNG